MSFWEWLRDERVAPKEGFMEFNQRYASDGAFRVKLRKHFRSAIKEYDLTSEEKRAARKYAEGRGDSEIDAGVSRLLDNLPKKYGH